MPARLLHYCLLYKRQSPRTNFLVLGDVHNYVRVLSYINCYLFFLFGLAFFFFLVCRCLILFTFICESIYTLALFRLACSLELLPLPDVDAADNSLSKLVVRCLLSFSEFTLMFIVELFRIMFPLAADICWLLS